MDKIAYVIVVKEEDPDYLRTTAFGAQTLEIAVAYIHERVDVCGSQSYPTFREGDLYSVTIMTRAEFTGEIDLDLSDLGYTAS